MKEYPDPEEEPLDDIDKDFIARMWQLDLKQQGLQHSSILFKAFCVRLADEAEAEEKDK